MSSSSVFSSSTIFLSDITFLRCYIDVCFTKGRRYCIRNIDFSTMVKKDTTVVSGLFICLHFFGSFCDAFNPIIRRPDTPILVYSTPGGGGRHTYVEGGDYDDVFSEIEAMGGGTRHFPVVYAILSFFSIYSAKLTPSFLFIPTTNIRMDSF